MTTLCARGVARHQNLEYREYAGCTHSNGSVHCGHVAAAELRVQRVLKLMLVQVCVHTLLSRNVISSY